MSITTKKSLAVETGKSFNFGNENAKKKMQACIKNKALIQVRNYDIYFSDLNKQETKAQCFIQYHATGNFQTFVTSTRS